MSLWIVLEVWHQSSSQHPLTRPSRSHSRKLSWGWRRSVWLGVQVWPVLELESFLRCCRKPWEMMRWLTDDDRTNVKPIYLSTKVIIPYWKEKKVQGLFLNLSSISEPRPRPYLVWYAASEFTWTLLDVTDMIRQRSGDCGKWTNWKKISNWRYRQRKV